MTTLESLERQCLEFVRNQSSGEWGDMIEAADANALATFVRGHLEPYIKRIRDLEEGLATVRAEALGIAEQRALDQWRWVAQSLHASISELGYPVGMGLAPNAASCELAATSICQHIARALLSETSDE
jgi:hypothetical protein